LRFVVSPRIELGSRV